jgi:hypothetical protein
MFEKIFGLMVTRVNSEKFKIASRAQTADQQKKEDVGLSYTTKCTTLDLVLCR